MKTDHTTILEGTHTEHLSKYNNITLPQAEEPFTSQEMLNDQFQTNFKIQ
jgi:hypothetical protein